MQHQRERFGATTATTATAARLAQHSGSQRKAQQSCATHTWGCKGLKAERQAKKAASSCQRFPAKKVSVVQRGQAQTAAIARAAAAVCSEAHLQQA
jgi:hypothetical protein